MSHTRTSGLATRYKACSATPRRWRQTDPQPRRSWPGGLRLRNIGRWLPPSLSISPSYPRGVAVTPRLLAVHIGHPRRQPILRRGALAGRGALCLDRGHDLFSSPAVLPAADRMSRVRTRESLRVVDPGPRSYLRAGRPDSEWGIPTLCEIFALRFEIRVRPVRDPQPVGPPGHAWARGRAAARLHTSSSASSSRLHAGLTTWE
jgi:hypothetical protein